jgi:hypothetical protein
VVGQILLLKEQASAELVFSQLERTSAFASEVPPWEAKLVQVVLETRA